MDDLIRRFRDYQIEWLTAHNDIEFCEEEEKMIIGFLKDTAESFVRENQSAQQWIPCSERMPEEYEEVWVTLRGSDMIVCKDGETLAEAAERVWKENIRVSIGFYGSDGWYSVDGYPSMISPVAWMPLPRPYREEATDG